LLNENSFLVVINHEEQYSIWPGEMDIPAGWRPEGAVGTEAECLDHIDTVWTDMRPLSLRQHISYIETDLTEVALNALKN
jgi:MbtH protein